MIDFGPLSARDDADLLKYFHKTDQANDLVQFRTPKSDFLFVARPGAGKTALVRGLESEVWGGRCLKITPDRFRVSDPTGRLNPADLRLILSSELLALVISDIAEKSADGGDIQKACKSFSGGTWKKITRKFFGKELKGLTILGCGFTLKEAARLDYVSELRSSRFEEEAESFLREWRSEIRLVLVMDDPELIVSEGFDSLTPENAARIGVLFSVLTSLHGSGVRIAAMLREHVLEAVRSQYENFQHFSDRISGLQWGEDDLLDLLKLRVRVRMEKKWGEVFAESEAVFQDEVFPYLVDGPRDLLFLCNSAVKRALPISITEIRRYLRPLRSQKVTEIGKRHRSHWPGIDRFCVSVIEILKQQFPEGRFPNGAVTEEFEQAFSDPGSPIGLLRTSKKMGWLDLVRWDSPKADEILFAVGCLGYVENGRVQYAWSGRSLEAFRGAEEHLLSPLFRL